MMIEPLLEENPNRFVIYPIRYHEVWDMYKKAQACAWHAEEIDMAGDLPDWERLNENEQYFIKHVLAFFAASDGIVNENLTLRFMNDVKIPEAKFFYGFQLMMENIHSETYSLLIDTFVKDVREKQRLLNAIDTIPCVRLKAQWALKWISDTSRFAHRLVAFAAVEGIFFSGSFCAIFWLKKRGLMHGLTHSNEYIARDEAMHCDFAGLLNSMLIHPLTREEALSIITEAVIIEQEFVCKALPVALIGMNMHLMADYIEYTADRVLMSLGYEKHYNTANPFEWMELISMDGKTSFFERRVADYKKSGIVTKTEFSTPASKFSITEDF